MHPRTWNRRPVVSARADVSSVVNKPTPCYNSVGYFLARGLAQQRPAISNNPIVVTKRLVPLQAPLQTRYGKSLQGTLPQWVPEGNRGELC